MGANAYAKGNHVALSDTSDLHTTAHEAAHVVQQSAGVQLYGGVGEPGDRYEKHADDVADAVVAGKSAEGLLTQMVGAPSGAMSGGGAVQMDKKNPKPGESFEFRVPAYKQAALGATTMVGVVVSGNAKSVTLQVGSTKVRSIPTANLIREVEGGEAGESAESGDAKPVSGESEARAESSTDGAAVSSAVAKVVSAVSKEVTSAKTGTPSPEVTEPPAPVDETPAVSKAPAAKKPSRRAKSRSAGGAARVSDADRTIKFTPRVNGKKKDLARGSDGTFSQGDAPAYKNPSAGAAGADLDLDATAALVHGLPAEYFGGTMEGGKLMSAYQRVGPTGSYGRDMDKRGGGGLAVYTRAVGAGQEDWRSMGYGVGSNDARIQLVLDPEILANEDHNWRSSTMDNGGMAPSATRNDLAAVKRGKDGMDTFDLWSKQSEKGRNQAFNQTVRGGKLENNEQMHWESIPLEGVLKAAVATCQESFDILMALEGAKRNDDDPTRGTVRVGETDVTVLLQDPNAPLLAGLRAAGVLDEHNHIV
jgi:hypothetical protein